jgi:hypothetical protein
MDSTGKKKTGYKKLLFCGEQAQQDGLQYFWIDTCCTIQTHHRRQRPTKRVAYAAENGGIMYIAFQYELFSYRLRFHLRILDESSNLRTRSCNEAPESDPLMHRLSETEPHPEQKKG